MAEEVVFEDKQILLRLDVEDIIRCKKVCKSWYSLISSSTFVKFHLKHNNTGRRRILTRDFCENLLGSSNGLICIVTSDNKLCVLNSCTGELKRLQNSFFNRLSYRKSFCYGFGYDSSSDDYKVIVGRQKQKLTRFYVQSLKSNSWTVVGDVKLDEVIGHAGILCNGALHWLIRDQYRKRVILAFHLSTEEFEEFPPPPIDGWGPRLGIIEKCLCIFDYRQHDHPKWVMKNYNDKHSWKLVPHLLQWDKDIVHRVKTLKLETYDQAAKPSICA